MGESRTPIESWRRTGTSLRTNRAGSYERLRADEDQFSGPTPPLGPAALQASPNTRENARKILEKSRKKSRKSFRGRAWNNSSSSVERTRATERSIAYRLLSVPPRRTTIMAAVISRARAIGKMLSMPVTLSAPGPAFAATAVWSRGKHSLPDLPYDYSALEPVISGEIMELHHSKHHQVR